MPVMKTMSNLLLLFCLLPVCLSAQSKEEAYYNGVEAFNAQEYQKAINYFNQVVNAKYEEFLAISYNYRGLSKKHLGQLSGAKKDFQRGLEIQHENLYLHNNLANIYYHEAKYETAIEHFAIALSFDSYNTTICTNLANSYFQLDMYNTAKKYYLKALEANPNNELAQFGVSEVERLQNIYGRAVYRPINDQLYEELNEQINEVQDMGEHL